MGDAPTCDYCRGTIDTSSDASLIVTIHRRVDADEWGDESFMSGGDDMFRFCSRAHLATYMERTPLPPAHDDESLGPLGVIFLVVLGLVMLSLAIGAAYGLYMLGQDVF
ncbi:MAG: hypothetical protein ACR2FE_04585 [Aeromicrobium sp.]